MKTEVMPTMPTTARARSDEVNEVQVETEGMVWFD
jgi:hypothetical protein